MAEIVPLHVRLGGLDIEILSDFKRGVRKRMYLESDKAINTGYEYR